MALKTWTDIPDNVLEPGDPVRSVDLLALRDNIIKVGQDRIGMVDWHAANAPPVRTLECDGSAVSRTTYADLFAEIGTTFGPGDGSTTFNLPDLRGEFVRGWDNGRGVDSGRAFGSAQGNAVQSHSHGNGSLSINVSNATGGGSSAARGSNAADSTTTVNGSTSNAGSSETRPRNIALMPVITYKGESE